MDSESKLQGSRPNDRPIPVCVVPYTDQDDEISLIDLWLIIVARKNLILLSLVVAIVLAFAYVFWAESSYRAETHLLPPQQRDIQGLIIGKEGLEITQYTPDLVYMAFLKNLKSMGLRREFFDTHDLADYYLAGKTQTSADIDGIFNTKFNDKLRVQADSQDASFVTASFGDRDPGLAAQRLNQFIAFANKRTVHQLFNNVNAVIQAEIERVRDQLTSKLKLAEQRRHDKIIRLQEALRVASSLGIERAGSFSVTTDKEKAGIEVNTAEVPLYMRGTKALGAEISVLESRKSDKPFISGLRDLQERRIFLEGLLINRDKLSAVTIDVAAKTPYRTEKPREKSIIVLAGVLGLMVGIFLIFIAELWSKARSQG